MWNDKDLVGHNNEYNKDKMHYSSTYHNNPEIYYINDLSLPSFLDMNYEIENNSNAFVHNKKYLGSELIEKIQAILKKTQDVYDEMVPKNIVKDDKNYLFYDDFFTSALIELDNFHCDEFPNVRSIRRDAVLSIQNFNKALDEKALQKIKNVVSDNTEITSNVQNTVRANSSTAYLYDSSQIKHDDIGESEVDTTNIKESENQKKSSTSYIIKGPNIIGNEDCVFENDSYEINPLYLMPDNARKICFYYKYTTDTKPVYFFSDHMLLKDGQIIKYSNMPDNPGLKLPSWANSVSENSSKIYNYYNSNKLNKNDRIAPIHFEENQMILKNRNNLEYMDLQTSNESPSLRKFDPSIAHKICHHYDQMNKYPGYYFEPILFYKEYMITVEGQLIKYEDIK